MRKTRAGKSHDYCDYIVAEKLHFQNVFRPYENENEKAAFSNSSGLKSVLEKLRFRDGLVWTVGLTVEIKLRFQNAVLVELVQNRFSYLLIIKLSKRDMDRNIDNIYS